MRFSRGVADPFTHIMHESSTVCRFDHATELRFVA